MSAKRAEAKQQFSSKGGKPTTKVVSLGPGSKIEDARVTLGKFVLFLID